MPDFAHRLASSSTEPPVSPGALPSASTLGAPPSRTLDSGADPELIDRLRQAVRGAVLGDAMSLGLYATDASMFQIWPLAVVLPLNREDALAAMRVAAQAASPILPRGGGTSLSGQAINRAVVIDASKHMNRLLELNVAERWACVEPGLTRDALNALLKPHGLHFAPDPATTSRANVGGMIANNAAGMRSILYGMTIDHLLGVDLALSTGELLSLGELDAAGWAAKRDAPGREGEIYQGFEALIAREREEILARYPKVRRRAGGYMLDAFAEPLAPGRPWNLAKIVAASEGTLGMILEAKLRLEPLPRHRFLCLAHFDSIEKNLAAVQGIVAHGPSAVELIDGMIIDLARRSRSARGLTGMIQGEAAGGILVVEAQGDDADDVRARLREISEDAMAHGGAYAAPVFADAPTVAAVWRMRKDALGLMTTVKGDKKPTPFIEDCAVPLAALPEYVARVRAICERHGRRIGQFAHVSVGLLHVRPLLDLHLPDELDVLLAIQEEVFEEVVRLGGSWSGEHGDGLVRGAYNERFFGPRLMAAFRELKGLFDPPGLMNPGHKVDVAPLEQNRAAMRYMPGYRMAFDRNWFHYRSDGGMRQAVEQCTGVGACRQVLGGVMCPSFIATRDEEHSTRGRANALRLAMTGQLGPRAMAADRLREVMDLCLACKGCAGECPNQVDVAKLKAEVLAHHHAEHGASARDRLFAGLARMAPLASGAMAPLVNAVLGLWPVRAALDRFFGIDRRRRLPRYARHRLTRWWSARGGSKTQAGKFESNSELNLELMNSGKENMPGGSIKDGDFHEFMSSRLNQDSGLSLNSNGQPRRVALFCDTYIEHFQSEVGRAAVEVLEAAGYRVELAVAGCCQRPAISKGMLADAKRQGTRVMERLDAWARQGVPILVCEPSCASALADDLPDLIDDAELGARVAACVRPIDQFLGEELAAGRIKLPWGPPRPQKLLVHGHCHHKAIFDLKPALALLKAIPGATVTEIDAGCCGMAGAFGYEKEHYDVSVKVAEDRFLPALRNAPPGARLVAAGFSCRHQVADLAARPAVHPVIAVREALALPSRLLILRLRRRQGLVAKIGA